MKKFNLVSSFLTYATKPDPSNTNRAFLVNGSLNMLINDAEKVRTRGGYQIFGATGVSQVPIVSSFEWEDSTEDEWPLRSQSTKLEVYLGTVNGVIFNEWVTLQDGFDAVDFVFDTYWDNTEKIDQVVFCNGDASLYTWSGGNATLLAITATTLRLQNGGTFGARRFLTTGTRSVQVQDTSGVWHTAVYTGGETTDTLTLTTDLTAFTFAPGAPILQTVQPHSSLTGVDAGYTIDVLRVVNDQLHIGSRSSRNVFVSKDTDITDYSFSTPRIAGEGATFTLDETIRAIRVFQQYVIYFTNDYLYRVNFTSITVGTQLSETADCLRLKTASDQGAIHHDLSAEIDNGIAYVSRGQEMLVISDVATVINPIITSYSDIIKPDFDALNFTSGHMSVQKNRIFITCPVSNLVYILETRTGVNDAGQVSARRFWQTPQILPISRVENIFGIVSGHSFIASETYNLFTGLRDRVDLSIPYDDNNGYPIIYRLYLANYVAVQITKLKSATRDELKHTDEIYNEGGISPVTNITCTYVFQEDKGSTEIITKMINGNNKNIVYAPPPPPALGDSGLGTQSLSGDNVLSVLPVFRNIHAMNSRKFFNMAARFESDDLDQEWELLAHGPTAEIDATTYATGIKT